MNQFIQIFVGGTIGLLFLCGASQAEALENRFVMESVGEAAGSGFVRLDTHTGEMSICKLSDGQLICRMAADERRALEDQIDLLEEKLARLAGPSNERSDTHYKNLPSDDEIDQSFGVMEKLMRRFFDLVEDLENETDKN